MKKAVLAIVVIAGVLGAVFFSQGNAPSTTPGQVSAGGSEQLSNSGAAAESQASVVGSESSDSKEIDGSNGDVPAPRVVSLSEGMEGESESGSEAEVSETADGEDPLKKSPVVERAIKSRFPELAGSQ